MTVTKLRRGFRIICTDSELAALRGLTARPPAPDLVDGLRPMAKAAIRSPRFTQPGGPLATTDESRRD